MLLVTGFQLLSYIQIAFGFIMITTMEVLHFGFLAYRLTFLRKHATCI